MTHANAPLTPEGRRRLAELIVDEGWTVRRAAERFQVSPATASKWANRLPRGVPMTDRSSRPHRQPAGARRLERRIVKLRFTRRWGPHRIGYHLGVPRSTVGRVLARYRMPLLAHLDQATGLPCADPSPSATRSPPRASWCTWTSRSSAGSQMAAGGASSAAGPCKTGVPAQPPTEQHAQVPTLTRLRLPPPRRRRPLPARLLRNPGPTNARRPLPGSGPAQRVLRQAGITVQAVMTDNGACYRSHAFASRTRRRSSTAAPAPTGPRPTARSNASTAPSPANGPTPRSTSPTMHAQPPTPTGSTSTITTDPTPASEASSPPTAFTTSRGTTPSCPNPHPNARMTATQ